MMNSGIFKAYVFLLVFTSCKPLAIKSKCPDDLDCLIRNVESNRRNKKSGIFVYPNTGFLVGLKTGKLDGEMSLIRKGDTIYYCRYKNNKPNGRFINKIFFGQYPRYYLILTIRPAISFGGKGQFNSGHKKTGFWNEYSGGTYTEGRYKNGLKTGLWTELKFNDAGGATMRKEILYEKGNVILSKSID